LIVEVALTAVRGTVENLMRREEVVAKALA
jgi:hypothetical protein